MRRQGSLALVVALAATLAVSCSNGGSGDKTTVRAVAATEAKRTFRVSVDSHDANTSTPPVTLLAVRAEGVVDLARPAMHMTLTLTQTADKTTSHLEVVGIIEDVWTKVSMEQDGNAVPTYSSDGGKAWRHTRRQPDTTDQIDPTVLLDKLRKNGGHLVRRGEESIRGVPTTRYDVTGAVLTSTSIADGSLTENAEQIWLDKDDVLRRITVQDVYAPSKGEKEVTREVLDFYDFGTAVDIQAPPPSDVVEVVERPPTTTTTSTAPPPLTGNEHVTFQPVLSTSAPPCRAPAVADAKGSECFTLGTVQWEQPVVRSARAEPKTSGPWVVELDLTDRGIAQFNDLARQCFDGGPTCPTKRIAVLVGTTVESAPMIQAQSYKADQIEISGNFTEQRAKDIVASIG